MLWLITLWLGGSMLVPAIITLTLAGPMGCKQEGLMAVLFAAGLAIMAACFAAYCIGAAPYAAAIIAGV